jgi:hypothetical protein
MNTKSVSICLGLAAGSPVPDPGDLAVAEHLEQLRALDDLDAPVGHHRDHVLPQAGVHVVQAGRLHQRAAGQDRGLAPGGLEERPVLQGHLGPPMITQRFGS